MIETDPIKRIMHHIELIQNHTKDMESHNLKTEPKHISRITPSKKELQRLTKTETLENTAKLNQQFNTPDNPIKLNALAITDHMKETIEMHHKLHNEIKLIKKQTPNST